MCIRDRHDGYLESENTIVTWCVGHLVTMSYPDVYKRQSTLFTKQHGILDVAAGIALAELSYICVIRWKKTERFRLWMEKKRI